MEEAKVGKILLMLIIENVHHSLWVSVTKRILLVPQTLQNKTLGVQWGILGLLFSLALLLTKGMKMWIVFRCENPCQFWRTRSVNVQLSPLFTDCSSLSINSHTGWVNVWVSGQRGRYNKKLFWDYSKKTLEADLVVVKSILHDTGAGFKNWKWLSWTYRIELLWEHTKNMFYG